MIEKINNELLNIINEGEGVTTEFKEASNKLPRSLFETVCAFLNRNGGNIFLGVSDNGEITGVNTEKINSMKKDFVNLCNNPEKIDPTIYLNIRKELLISTYVNKNFIQRIKSIHMQK